MIRDTCTLLIALIASIHEPAAAGKTKVAPPRSDLDQIEFTIKVPPSTQPSQAILVTAALENRSPRRVIYGAGPRGFDFAPMVRDAAGRPCESTRKYKATFFGHELRALPHPELGPGERVSQNINLSEFFVLKKPGVYWVSVECFVSFADEPNKVKQLVKDDLFRIGSSTTQPAR